MCTESKNEAPQNEEQAGVNVDGQQVRSMIRAIARRIVNRTGMPRCELDDLEQEFVMILLEAIQEYDPDRGPWLPYAKRILERAAKNILRARIRRQAESAAERFHST